MDSNLLKDVANYWRKVKSGELRMPGPNEIDNTVWTVETAIKHIAELGQAMHHIHGAAMDITVPRTAIAKAAELAVEYSTMQEQSNG